jgi:hypothetical protein
VSKLALQIESLVVQSFDTTPFGGRGPGRGAAAPEPPENTCAFSCASCAPDETCGGTCPPACASDGWGGCGATAGTCQYTQPQPTCYGSACETWCCSENTACGAYATCGHVTCAFECTVTCQAGCVE